MKQTQRNGMSLYAIFAITRRSSSMAVIFALSSPLARFSSKIFRFDCSTETRRAGLLTLLRCGRDGVSMRYWTLGALAVLVAWDGYAGAQEAKVKPGDARQDA